MQAVNEIFEKIIYESQEYEESQRRIDRMLKERVLPLLCADGREAADAVMNESSGIILAAQRECFALGFKYGMALSRESVLSSDDADHFE